MNDERLGVAPAMADDDDFVPNAEHRALWAQADSLEDLGELMARWLEGGISYQPGYSAAGPDAETASLVPILAELNRAGYVTDFSQPGIALNASGDGQRASVAGFCSEVMAVRLMDAVCRTDLVVVAGEPDEPANVSIVVTVDDGREFTWMGRGPDPDSYVGDLSEEMFVRLMSAFYVEIFDPCWGRNDLLWSTLRAAAAGAGSGKV